MLAASPNHGGKKRRDSIVRTAKIMFVTYKIGL